MAYTPTSWQDGDVITSSRINNIERGVESASTVDATLTESGVAADSKAVGNKIAGVRGLITSKEEGLLEHIWTAERFLLNLNTSITQEISTRTTADEEFSTTIDTIASLDNAVTASDSELVDIRVKVDGTTATSAGIAVREQINELKNEIDKIRHLFPPVLTYMAHDGSYEITREAVYCGGDGTVENTFTIDDPQYIYTPNGWSLVPNGNPDPEALIEVNEDRTVFAAYDKVIRTYTVRFYNGTSLLQTVNDVPYGETAVYTGATPTYTGTDAENYEFSKWKPSNEEISGNTDCYAKFRYTGILTYKYIDRSISGEYDNDTVATVRHCAFADCTSLAAIDFPVARSIGYTAFGRCTNLTTVNLPAATSIGDGAFDGCSKLTTVSFPAATSIGGGAFNSCSKLTTVNLPIAISIGGGAFNGCTSLMEIDLPAVTNVEGGAFAGCTALTTVNFPVATIVPNYAFAGCSNLTTVVLGVTSIGDNYFANNYPNLTTVTLPAATSIGSGAFSNCSSLTTVNLPVAISIGAGAFNSCSSLTEVSLPAATSIGSSAFRSCSSLTEVSLPVATSIDNSAFSSCSKLTEVSLPVATSIENYAFSGCSSLTTVSLSVATSIGSSAFQSCSSLTSISLPAATSIGSSAFRSCSKLTEVSLGNTEQVATLSNTSAFQNSNNAIIYVPDALVSDYKSATNWSSLASRIKGMSELPT